MVAVLPYPWQLNRDIALKSVPKPTPAPAPSPPPYVPPTLPEVVEPNPYQIGGPWYGDTPPDNPFYGWLWVNSANNGLYVYGQPGIWVQVGTNW